MGPSSGVRMPEKVVCSDTPISSRSLALSVRHAHAAGAILSPPLLPNTSAGASRLTLIRKGLTQLWAYMPTRRRPVSLGVQRAHAACAVLLMPFLIDCKSVSVMCTGTIRTQASRPPRQVSHAHDNTPRLCHSAAVVSLSHPLFRGGITAQVGISNHLQEPSATVCMCLYRGVMQLGTPVSTALPQVSCI